MENNRHGKKRLLVVDDELIIRNLLAEVLAEAGYLVELSGDGYHALKMLQNDAHYDVILMDVKMPKIDGITLCRKIRGDSPVLKQRFLFLIGNVDDEILSFLQENNYPYLPKPFTIPELLNKISSILTQEEKTAGWENMVGQTKTERRMEKRFHLSSYCLISPEDGPHTQTIPLTAKTQDISQNGAKIHYLGQGLKPGGSVNIHIMNLNIRRTAKIIWSKALSELDVISGLRFMEPIPIPVTTRETVL
jgi:CheY-like chemotaxis protein